MPDRRAQLRLWLYSLERFELRLRGRAAKARNAFIIEASAAYAEHAQIPAWINERHRRRIAPLLKEHYAKVMPHFGAIALKQVKSRRIHRKAAEDYFLDRLREWAATQALAKARLIASTDADDVRTAIQDGLEEGLGTPEIARNIRKVSSLTPFRAAVIARTETHAAAAYGSIESVRAAEQDLGIRMLKIWLPTLDDRTRPEHAAMRDHPAIPLGEKFPVGNDSMDRPGDPSASPENTINCRCALAYEEATN